MLPISSKPDPEAKSFNWPNARACLNWCAAAYSEHPTIYARATDAELLVYEYPDCVVIAFRGSEDPLDYLQDAKCRLVQLSVPADGLSEVHEGFLQDWTSIQAQLISMLRPMAAKPLFITGHSLGGALAILCALELMQAGYVIAGVYTFGQPRVGNGLFATDYDQQHSQFGGLLHDITWRVVNQNDIVPRIPWLGYRHCGNEIFLPTGGGWSINPPTWTKTLSDALGFFYCWRHRGEVLVSEHHIESYQERIQLLQ